MKYRLRDLCVITKDNDEKALVEIEGRREAIRMDEPLYDVREVISRKSYPAGEQHLEAFNQKNEVHRELHPWTRGKPVCRSGQQQPTARAFS